jgi:hypothetical protein
MALSGFEVYDRMKLKSKIVRDSGHSVGPGESYR